MNDELLAAARARRLVRLTNGAIVTLLGVSGGTRARVHFEPGIEQPPSASGHDRTIRVADIVEIIEEGDTS